MTPLHQDAFVADYLALIDSLRQANPKARFLLALMTPIGSEHPRFLSGTRDWHGQIQQAIRRVAHAAGAQLIDFHTPLYPYPWLLPDAVHPDVEGAGILARTAYSAITGDYGGLQLSALYRDHMVLPREKAFAIRGRADARESIRLTLDGVRYRTQADANGQWSIPIPPTRAHEGASLRVETDMRTLEFSDIAFGDIWLCSGQSNMEFPTRLSSDVVPERDPGLRLYRMDSRWRTNPEAFPAILKDWTRNDLIMAWARERALLNLSAQRDTLQRYHLLPLRHPYEPAYNFEAGILPLEHFPITGVIWYQGESNADRIEVYEKLFPLLVDSWRAFFRQPALPFYYVQLSSLNRPSWPLFRDTQRRLVESRPGLGMAVSSDLGDPYDVHYREKKPVGERLARQALEKYYGHPLRADGPLVENVYREGSTIWVDFGRQSGLHSADGASIQGFEVLDAADGLFHPVEARVPDEASGKLLLDGSAVREPAAVRYGWQPYTRATLVNAEGLPASTFRMSIP